MMETAAPTMQSTTQPKQETDVVALYEQGYRVKRLTDRTGAMKEPCGDVYRFNIYASVCTCQPRKEQVPGHQCIHLRMYSALRIIQFGKRLEKQSREETPRQEGAV